MSYLGAIAARGSGHTSGPRSSSFDALSLSQISFAFWLFGWGWAVLRAVQIGFPAQAITFTIPAVLGAVLGAVLRILTQCGFAAAVIITDGNPGSRCVGRSWRKGRCVGGG